MKLSVFQSRDTLGKTLVIAMIIFLTASVIKSFIDGNIFLGILQIFVVSIFLLLEFGSNINL